MGGYILRRAVAVLLWSGAWIAGANVTAQAQTEDKGQFDARPDSLENDYIVVTALKRDQSLLDTPVTINVLSQEALRSANVSSAHELNGIVPGLTMMPAVGMSPAVTFRGLGTNIAVASTEPSVAFFLDGAYLPHLRSYVAPLYDVDHIEFVKGTQSTLLGRNVSIGAISISTRRPESKFGYEIVYTNSFRLNGDKAEAVINIPLAQSLSMRVAGYFADDDGYYKNTVSGASQPRSRIASGRIKLDWQPSNAFSLLASYQRDDHNVRGQPFEVLKDPANTLRNRALAIGQSNFDSIPNYVASDGQLAFDDAPAGPRAGDHQVADRGNLIASLSLGDYQVTAQSSYLYLHSRAVTDFDWTQANLYNNITEEENEVFTQEIRLASPSYKPFSFIVGGFYIKDNYDFRRQFVGFRGGGAFSLFGDTENRYRLTTTAYSAFSSVSLKVLESVRLIGGLRYTSERKRGTLVRTGTPNVGTTTFPPIPFTRLSNSTKTVDGNVGVQYRPGSDILLYASWSKGSKAGGFNEFPTTVAGAPFAGENAYTTEVGGKFDLDNGGYVTFSAFRTAVKGFQTSVTQAVGNPPALQPVIGNSNISTRGLEASGGVRFGRLNLSGSVTYADAHFDDDFSTVAVKGAPLVRAPKWSGRFDIGHSEPLWEGYDLNALATLRFSSQTLFQFRNSATSDAPVGAAHQELDVRLGVRDRDRGIELAVLATNLTGAKYVTFAAGATGAGAPLPLGSRSYYGSLNRPRVVSLQVSVKK